ncbi:MAG: helix-turn-helix domain-containing protein [Actinomycetota bacterium]|nr:helix-turn-helix domain-containing protein [Actinomycetota bacterium]
MKGATVPKTATIEQPPLMDLDAVARRLGVNHRHIRRLVAERRIPYLKWAHLLRFDPVEIEAWLDGVRRG